MRHAEFDKFADEYLASHAANVRISGEDPAYFARYKIVELRRMWTRRRLVEPATILDFGSGIGASLPHLARAFPRASLTAFDVSARSLAIAEGRFPNIATFVHGDNLAIFPKASFDLVFTSCVFHHVDERQHVDLFHQLHGLLRPNGAVVVFEHNPVNPITRYIVATCPFDENAVLIPSAVLTSRQREANFKCIETAIPASSRMLSPGCDGSNHIFRPCPWERNIIRLLMPDSTHQRPSDLIAELGRVLRFGIVGGLNTVIGGCAIVALEWGCGVHPLLTNAAGFASGMIVGFLPSRTFVFRERTRNRWIVVRYTIAVASAFALNQVVLALLNGRLPKAPGAVFAQGAAMVSYTIVCFILCRFWVFRTATLTYRQASPPAL